jgi:hypothetical protein
MYGSKQLVKREKPRKLRRQEEEVRDKQRKKQQQKQMTLNRGYDMWEDSEHE